jgi:hypothetical protein
MGDISLNPNRRVEVYHEHDELRLSVDGDGISAVSAPVDPLALIVEVAEKAELSSDAVLDALRDA